MRMLVKLLVGRFSELSLSLREQWWGYRIRTCDFHRVNVT